MYRILANGARTRYLETWPLERVVRMTLGYLDCGYSEVSSLLFVAETFPDPRVYEWSACLPAGVQPQ